MPTDAEVVEMGRRTTAVVRLEPVPDDPEELIAASIRSVLEALDRQGIEARSTTLVLHRADRDGRRRMEVGVLTDEAVAVDGDVVPGRLPRCRALRRVHEGRVDARAWSELEVAAERLGATTGSTRWEMRLLSEADGVDPDEALTELTVVLD